VKYATLNEIHFDNICRLLKGLSVPFLEANTRNVRVT